MQISEINLREESGLISVEAKVTWEEADKPPFTLFFETDAQFYDILGADPNGFLVASILPACHAGERRIQIEGSLCPVLCSNITSALMVIKSWYFEMGEIPIIEPSSGFKTYLPSQKQAVSFLSCGIDSLATLRWNKLNLPSDHPASIAAVVPLDFIKASFMTEQEARNLNRLRASIQVSADVRVRVIPIRTNILRLDGDGYFFSYKWHGAILSSVGYVLSKGFSRVYIASSDDANHLSPWGSHPLLDHLYSSAYLQIEHQGIQLSRSQKVALVADWDVGLQNILVCQGKNPGESNCGACEKCIRTMTALVALGKLKDCRSFPVNDVSPKLLKTLHEYNMGYEIYYYKELIPSLEKCGRNDLADIINQLISIKVQEQSQPDHALQEILALIPSGNKVILANKEKWGNGTVAGRDIYYWGTPSNIKMAIHELESLQQSGFTFIVFGRAAFWWFAYYPGLKEYLHEKFQCLLDDEHSVIFDLRYTPSVEKIKN